jgi:hypothetical protein
VRFFNEEAAGGASECVSTLVDIDLPSHLAPPDELARLYSACRSSQLVVGTAGATSVSVRG